MAHLPGPTPRRSVARLGLLYLIIGSLGSGVVFGVSGCSAPAPADEGEARVADVPTRSLLIGADSVEVAVFEVPGGFFDTRPVRPLLGRTFMPADVQAGSQQVAVISHDLWQTRFAGRPSVVGEMVYLDDVPTRIIGIMPTGFSEPEGVDLWLPIKAGSLE